MAAGQTPRSAQLGKECTIEEEKDWRMGGEVLVSSQG